MKAHTSDFKNQIKNMGRELDSKITYTLNGVNVELGGEQLNSITPTYQGALLKSVMKELDIDSNVYIPEKTILNYQFGIKVNGEYEYINYGNYVVYKAEKQEDTNSYKLTCYDKMLYSMVDYEKMDITYPISIRDYIKAICNKLGLTFANENDTFANYDKQIQNELYLNASGNSLGYTFRDVLDELSQVTASCICINGNDELEIRYINETNDTIDEEFLKDINVNFGEKYGAINTIVLSRSADSDNIYYPEILPENPFEFKISDNQIMNFNDRSDYLPDIYEKLNGLEFYINDFSSTGICYYELLDKYNVKIGDNTYSCIMLNDEVLVTQGLEENVYTELPEQTETDYKHASKDDRMINQVYIIAKKNEAEILALVSTTETIQKEINPTKDESGSEIIIEDASNNPLTYLEIEGKSIQETSTQSANLCPPFTDSRWTFTNGASVTSEGYLSIPTTTGARATITIPWNKSRTCYFKCIIVSGGNAHYSSDYLDATGTLLQDNGKATVDKGANYQDGTMWGGNNKYGDALTQATSIKFTIQFSSYTPNPYVIKDLIISENNINYIPFTPNMPSPDYPSEIESVGYENLFDGKFEQGTFNYNNGANISNEKIIRTNMFKILPNTTYTFSINEIIGEFGATFFSGETLDTAISGFGKSEFQKKYYVFTTPKNAKYMKFRIGYPILVEGVDYGKNVDNDYQPQLNKGSTPRSFVPYGKYGIELKVTNGTDTNTSLFVLDQPLRSLPNGVKDELVIENGRAKIIKNVAKMIVANGNFYVGTTWNGYFVQPEGKINEANNRLLCDRAIANRTYTDGTMYDNEANVMFVGNNTDTIETLKAKYDGATLYYQLATPTEIDLGEVETLSTFKGVNNITTTDSLLPIINLTYVRDTIIADYVENHVAELKLTEKEIKTSVESVSSSVDGLNSTVNRVEEITNDNSQVLNIISTNIDRTSGEVREVTTTTGFTFNAEGMAIADGSGFKAQHTAQGTFYKDGDSITGQYTKDGSKQKDLELFGTYSYGKNDINDIPMFVAQLYTDENGEECFGHFVNI